MKSYRLEFNPDSECPWHIEEEPSNREPNTKGWTTVVVGVGDLEAIREFIQYIDFYSDDIFTGSWKIAYTGNQLESKFWDFFSGWNHNKRGYKVVSDEEAYPTLSKHNGIWIRTSGDSCPGWEHFLKDN